MFHIRYVTCQRHQNGTSWVFIDDFTNFLHVTTCRGMTWMVTFINRSFQTFESRTTAQNSMLFPWHCHQQLIWIFCAFPVQCSLAVSKHSCNCIIQPLENLEFLSTWTKVNTHQKAMQRIMAAKPTELTQKVVILLYIVAESCRTCHSRSSSEFRNFWTWLHILR